MHQSCMKTGNPKPMHTQLTRSGGLTALLASVCLVLRSCGASAAPPEPHSVPPASIDGTGSTVVPRPELALGRSPLYDYDPPQPGSYRLPPLKPAGDGDVLGTDGKPQRMRECYKDHISVVSFIYTRCTDPQACPYAMGMLHQLHQLSRQDPLLARNLHLVTFSFDPDHDTPEVMASFDRHFHTGHHGARWTFLTTRSTSELQSILQSYGQTVDRKSNPKDALGPLFHSVRVFLIDRRGMIRNIYSYALLDPRLLVADIRTLLMEKQGTSESPPPGEASRLPGATPSSSR